MVVRKSGDGREEVICELQDAVIEVCQVVLSQYGLGYFAGGSDSQHVCSKSLDLAQQ